MPKKKGKTGMGEAAKKQREAFARSSGAFRRAQERKSKKTKKTSTAKEVGKASAAQKGFSKINFGFGSIRGRKDKWTNKKK